MGKANSSVKERNGSREILYSIIGLVIMLLGFVLPAVGPITPVGMRVLFIFVGALFLWSTVGGRIWPSLVAVFLFAVCGYNGEGAEGFIPTMTAVYGDETFIQVMMMVFASALLTPAASTPCAMCYRSASAVSCGGDYSMWMWLLMWFMQ